VTTITLVDNGGANLASLRHAFARLGAGVTVTRDGDAIRAAERVVLPGVGAAGDGMRRLRSAGLDALIPSLTQPVLGICLGMQLLYEHSAEDATDCLGVFAGTVTALRRGAGFSVPHMGWNQPRELADHPMLTSISEADWFYFAHGYVAPVNIYSLATADCGQPFTAVAAKNNFVAAQFHPERSARAGARFLQNFLDW
jgi:glutamine amidotransferase